jgi:poly-gamma-glutamate synthesis protein (capsule biosynthesis protein)
MIITFFLLVCIFFFGAGLLWENHFSGPHMQSGTGAGERTGELPPPDSVSESPAVDLTIAAVGDILIHNTLYYAAYQPASESYDFSGQFKHIKPYLEKADIAIANLETTLAGPEAGYAGYPKFNTPDSIVDALQGAGIDILTAANNHRLDQGIPGFYRTIRIVREKGLDIIGVKSAEPEKTYVIKEIKGIKIAFLNFGYAFPLANGGLDINGLFLPMNMTGLIDTVDPQDLDKSVKSIAKKVSAAREDGAEVIVVSMHWGDEYHRAPNDFQQKLAVQMAGLGVNVIFGGHPHVLQPAVYVSGPEGESVPVFYSLGNFISDQRKETVDDIYTEQGMIAKVTLRVWKNKKPAVVTAEAVPTWVNKKITGGRFVYEVIPRRKRCSPRKNSRCFMAAIRKGSDSAAIP